MSEILYDSTRDSLLKLWSEIQENPFHPYSGLSKDIWNKILELEEIETSTKLNNLNKELEQIKNERG